MPVMSSALQQARLAVIGCEMVTRSLRLLINMASQELARVQVSTQSALGGTTSGHKALGHFSDCGSHLGKAMEAFYSGRKEVKAALTQLHQI